MLRVFSLLVFLLFSLQTLFARDGRELQLFQKDSKGQVSFVEDYDQKINSLKENDVLVFTDGTRVVFTGRTIGHGSNSLVLEIRGGDGVRVPIDSNISVIGAGVIPVGMSRMDVAKNWFQGMKKLEALGVPVVKVQSNAPAEYAIVEVMKEKKDIFHFLEGTKGARDDFKNAFLEYNRNSALMSRIGDMHPYQFIYSDGKIKIVDTSDIKLKAMSALDNTHSYANRVQAEMPSDSLFALLGLSHDGTEWSISGRVLAQFNKHNDPSRVRVSVNQAEQIPHLSLEQLNWLVDLANETRAAVIEERKKIIQEEGSLRLARRKRIYAAGPEVVDLFYSGFAQRLLRFCGLGAG